MARISLATVLAFLAAVEGSFTIPPDTPDGVYGVTYDQAGNAHHISKRDGSSFVTFKPRLGPADFSDKFSLTKRADGAKCVDSGAVLVRNDINQAQYALGDACNRAGDQFIPDHGNRYSKFGNAVVYVCNYGKKSQHCSSGELDSDLSDVQKLCGDVAGTFTLR